MAKYGIFDGGRPTTTVTYNRPTKLNTIETVAAKDYSAMIAIHFAQWMAMNYSEVLMKEKGEWYVEQFLYFESEIWPKWIGNGGMVDYLDELKKQQKQLGL